MQRPARLALNAIRPCAAMQVCVCRELQGTILFQRSLSANSRLAGLAQAARPLAGGSPNHVRDLALRQGSLGRLAQLLTRRLKRVHMQSPPEARLCCSELRSPCSRASIESMARSHQLCVPVRQAQAMRPNPSFEPTAPGVARSLFPRRSVAPWSAAQLKR
jgi:hypothetical protein